MDNLEFSPYFSVGLGLVGAMGALVILLLNWHKMVAWMITPTVGRYAGYLFFLIYYLILVSQTLFIYKNFPNLRLWFVATAMLLLIGFLIKARRYHREMSRK